MGFRHAPLALLVTVLGCGDNHHLGGEMLLITPQVDLYTDEAGTETTFSLALSAEPIDEVIISLTSLDLAEGRVSPKTIIIAPETYAMARIVTLTGVDDFRVDGDRTYAVRIGTDWLGSFDLEVTNGDDDVAGVTVSPIVGLATTEAGGAASFTVQLDSEPVADVAFAVASGAASEGVPDTSLLVFTPATWNVVQTVTVTGVQDVLVDGDVTYSIAIGPGQSVDPSYLGLDPDDVTFVNRDDDDVSAGGIDVTPASGLVVSETGTTATFSVSLQTPPTANVTIAVASSDATEATASTSSLVFTPANGSIAQIVTITGIDDDLDDGKRPFTITLGLVASADPVYAGTDPADVSGLTDDDDTAGVTVTPTSGLATSESGGVDSFTVVLDAEPMGTVSIDVTSSDTTEGTVSTSSLVFTPANWSSAQTVTVTGVNDSLTDGAITYSIILAATASSDAEFIGIDPTDVSVTNADNDLAAVVFDSTSLVTSEFRDADSVMISLATPPTANVTIGLTSSDTTEGVIAVSSVTFTPANWNVPQTVFVTGVDDALSDGNITFSIVTAAATSTDPAYSGLDAADITVVNLDNDTAQVYVKARNRHSVAESGQTSTFRVRLTVAPTATVTCTLFSTDLTEGTVSPLTLTFQPNSFGFQTVTITGVDDALDDGDIPFSIVLNPCTSTDPAYQGSNPRDVAALNRDDD